MFKTLVVLSSFLVLSMNAGAETWQIHSIVPHEVTPTTTIVKFVNGRVGFLVNANKSQSVEVATLTDEYVEVKLNERNEIVSIAKTQAPAQPAILKSIEEEPDFDYKPSIFTNYQKATDALLSFRKGFMENAQCYDKAHIWSYEENTRYGGRLMKAFIFFSDSYISNYNFKWWFHTAPYTLVRMNGVVNERIMDASFSKWPLQLKIWTDIFMKNKYECKVIEKYSDYSTHPGEDDCYLMKAHMYFWQPKDLEAFEQTRAEKTKFINWEIKHAYKEAFGIEMAR